MQVKTKKIISPFMVIVLSFLGLITVGSVLLALPCATQNGTPTPYIDSLFTAVSAACVTGLVVYDTSAHWSLFGQIVILVLIQLGGLGITTVALSLLSFANGKLSVAQRGLGQQTVSSPKNGGVKRRIKFVCIVTAATEFVGMLALLPVFCADYGGKGVWLSLFHSVSAFCNAGFDIIESGGAFSSVVCYASNPLLNLTLMALIVIGGLGFFTWENIIIAKFRPSKYVLQTKLVLITTSVLILLPAIAFFFMDFTDMPFGERLLASLFQSVTARTAGFNTVNLSEMSDFGISMLVMLMLIGGSPGSTAGGFKTVTLAVLIAGVISSLRRKEDVCLFKRRLPRTDVTNAFAIFILYLLFFWVGGMTISAVENLPAKECLFEAASAIGTVGLSLGITPSLGIASKVILAVLMFFGRVGCFTIAYVVARNAVADVSKLPTESVTIG